MRVLSVLLPVSLNILKLDPTERTPRIDDNLSLRKLGLSIARLRITNTWISDDCSIAVKLEGGVLDYFLYFVHIVDW